MPTAVGNAWIGASSSMDARAPRITGNSITPKPAKREVTLVDQFGIVETKTVKPQFLCNPAAVDGGAIKRPLRHLECHKIKGRKVKQTVTAVNAFGTEEVTTKKAVALCLPSGKNEQVTTTTTAPPGSTTSTTTGTELRGRAVGLDFDTGPFTMGSILCLDLVQAGCIAGPDACPGDHLHQTISIEGVSGTFPDQNQAECGHGEIIVAQPGCGPDTVPDCP